MSIIYDALNKVEKNGVNNSEKKENKKQPLNLKIYLLYGLILVLGFIGSKVIFSLLSGQPESVKAASVQQAVNTPKKPAAVAVVQAPVSATSVEKSPSSTTTPSEDKVIEPPPLVLNGTFVSPEEKLALINNNIVREGEQIEGVNVVSISEGKVEMEYQGLKFSLTSAAK